eukprot:TRINITY_DN2283_c0_g2_i2.p1 TRINITY_DN2283_c0_g2~~TRINITY_DN2283_c0_g2_i2.p1  ORF type:complete len:235 (+),score=60.18 TRINITY_DN2283_c0_g2_i2:58-705(+)
MASAEQQEPPPARSCEEDEEGADEEDEELSLEDAVKSQDDVVWMPWTRDVSKQHNTDIAEVLQNFLFLGDLHHASDRAYLAKHHIRHVLCVIDDRSTKTQPPPRLFDEELECNDSTRAKITLRRLWLSVRDRDETRIADVFDTAFSFIDEARDKEERILVHCIAGRSRSPTIILGYLITREKMTLQQAYHHVREKRGIIRPNNGFLKQLGNRSIN